MHPGSQTSQLRILWVWLTLVKSLREWAFHFFIFFSRTTGPILIKLVTEHHWVKGIQVNSNVGPCSFPRGNNYEMAKFYVTNGAHGRLVESWVGGRGYEKTRGVTAEIFIILLTCIILQPIDCQSEYNTVFICHF